MSDAHETKDDAHSNKLTDVDVVVKGASPPSELSQVPPYEEEITFPPPPVLTPEEEARLWRKIDWRIMPILTMMYLFSFVDRGNIGAWSLHHAAGRALRAYAVSLGNAKLQGLVTQLDLTGTRYNAALVSIPQPRVCTEADRTCSLFSSWYAPPGVFTRSIIIDLVTASRTMSVPFPQSTTSLDDQRTRLLTIVIKPCSQEVPSFKSTSYNHRKDTSRLCPLPCPCTDGVAI